MSDYLKPLMVATLCVIALIGCKSEVNHGVCGTDGTFVSVSGSPYCTYSKAIQITGFQCPVVYPHAIIYNDLLICAQQATVATELLAKIEAKVGQAKNEPTDSDAAGDKLGPDVDLVTTADVTATDVEICTIPEGVSCMEHTGDFCCFDSGEVAIKPVCTDGRLVCNDGRVLSTVCRADASCKKTEDRIDLDPETITTEIEQGSTGESIKITGYDKETKTCVLMSLWRSHLLTPDEPANTDYCSPIKTSLGLTDHFSARYSLHTQLVANVASKDKCTAKLFTEVAPKAVGTELFYGGCFGPLRLSSSEYNHSRPVYDFSFITQESGKSIRVFNRSTFTPSPVSFTFSRQSDVPEDVWVQTSDALGFPTWFKIRKKGESSWLRIFDGCDVPRCGEGGGVCGMAMFEAKNISGGTSSFGQITRHWDGYIRRYNEQKNCQERVPAVPGVYEAQFCYSLKLEMNGDTRVGLGPVTCKIKEFVYPSNRVSLHRADGG